MCDPGAAAAAAAEPETECQICCEELEPGTEVRNRCGHAFCGDCTAQYVGIKVKDDGDGAICCPAFKCPIRMEAADVKKALGDEELVARYDRLLVSLYVQDNPLLRWCPGTDCEMAAMTAEEPNRKVGCAPVTCSCGTGFCVSCGGDVHTPASCPMAKEWLKRCAEDSATAGWISTKTKDCPKCGSAVEKNGGCNSVHCRCGQEFCWICLTSHNNHSFGDGKGACNRYDEKKELGVSEERKAVQRYLHYFTRYENHQNSLKLEAALDETVKEKVKVLAPICGLERAREFLERAVSTLHICRKQLMWTYAFAYNVVGCPQQVLFEDNQADLEEKVEKLSGVLENKLEDVLNDPAGFQQQVINGTNYCASRGDVLVAHVADGYTKRDWKFKYDSLAY